MLEPKASKVPWVIYSTSPVKLVSFSSKVLEFNENVWTVTENYKASNDEEISLKKGQLVEVLVKPHGSSRWRVRLLLNEGVHLSEGWAPHTNLKRSSDADSKKKRHSDISHSSSEGKSGRLHVILYNIGVFCHRASLLYSTFWMIEILTLVPALSS